MSHFVSFASEPVCLSPNKFGIIIDCMKPLFAKFTGKCSSNEVV